MLGGQRWLVNLDHMAGLDDTWTARIADDGQAVQPCRKAADWQGALGCQRRCEYEASATCIPKSKHDVLALPARQKWLYAPVMRPHTMIIRGRQGLALPCIVMQPPLTGRSAGR